MRRVAEPSPTPRVAATPSWPNGGGWQNYLKDRQGRGVMAACWKATVAAGSCAPPHRRSCRPGRAHLERWPFRQPMSVNARAIMVSGPEGEVSADRGGPSFVMREKLVVGAEFGVRFRLGRDCEHGAGG
jgi:hypothetical protein